jgi:hypothetical protein
MGMQAYNHLGIYLEINKKNKVIEKFNYCEQTSCPSHKVKNKVKNKFCSMCGKAMAYHEIIKRERFLDSSEIEKAAGLDNDVISELDSCSSSKYFSYNIGVAGVPEYSIDDDTFNDVEINSSNIVESLKNDKAFSIVNSKLKHTFGDNYVVHYGIYTSVY